MKKIALFAIVPLLLSCSGRESKGGAADEAAKAGYTAKPNIVDTILLKRGVFEKEIISNGRLRAVTKSELTFRNDGVIAKISVNNGDYISSGGVIATLDDKLAKLQYESALLKMDKAKLDFADALIGYGYGRDSSGVPKDMLEIIKIRSGYKSALSDLKNASATLENLKLIAPISGKVANISKKCFENSSGVFCTIIDDKKFETDFNILESELGYVRKGSRVKVRPFTDTEGYYEGYVDQINPVVDERGQIMVKAVVLNSNGKLMEGMNVKVVIDNMVPGKLVVPKGAVVMRDNFDVVFRLDRSTGKAMWTYVTVELSNSTSHAIRANADKNAELNAGDIIIVSGNLNLADGSNVEIKSK